MSCFQKCQKVQHSLTQARKEVVDEEYLLYRIFEERPDFRYASDIEPVSKNMIAEKFAGRFFFTPKKIGAQTSEA